MARTKSAISLVVLAALAPWLYDRYIGLSTIVVNRPGKLLHVNGFKGYEVKFADRIRNCEDVVLEEELGVAILSCDPGRDRWNTVMGAFHPPSTTHPEDNNGAIWIYDYSTSQALTKLSISNAPTLNSDFHPLGIALDPKSSTLYIVNHARSGSCIEILHLDLPARTATHVRSLTHPLLHAPNAIEIFGNGKLYVSNDHYIRAAVSPLLSKIETFSGAPGGSVVYIDTNDMDASKIVARVPFANGIARLNDTTLVVASSSKPGLYFYSISPDLQSLELKNVVRTPAGADNLSIDSNSKILIAGHPFAPTLMHVAEGRWDCDEKGTQEQKAKCGCWAPSWVGEWSEEGGLRTVLRDGGEKVCSSSTAVRDGERGVGFVSMLYGRGVVVFRE
ncbi:calcium-dependent phosphotriesterase [Ophiobolus disseminans]|uniref:Calcium-dependent phosphotriesterase n=1 Tax=Ophiobolus disseminans TaxID=1469910 RepID=A0A6A6ZG50_9PLEO|nr:calcium-dependent phosphotriesterase [Ophiobolus disseminans]